MTADTLESLLVLARKYGVAELSTEGVSFKLLPPTPEKSAKAPEAPNTPVCACGCALYLHNVNGCKLCGPKQECIGKRS